MSACPTKAITAPGKVDRERCIQSRSSRFDLLDEEMMEVWGTRIYGCQTCQDVCPFNRNTVEAAPCRLGIIGKGIGLQWLLRSSEEEIKSGLKKTALAMSWIEPAALKRNAIIAAAAGDYTELTPVIKGLSQSKNEIFRKTALWALEKLRASPLSES
jgi:epoxyqueuosine reductase